MRGGTPEEWAKIDEILVAAFDAAKVDMDLFEAALMQLNASELVHQFEELVIILHNGEAKLGDVEKHMRVRRVIIRKVHMGEMQ